MVDADGKVVYKVEIDDSGVEKQLNDVDSTVKKSSQKTADKQKKEYKEVTKEFEIQSEKVKKVNKSTNADIEKQASSTTASLKDMFAGAAEDIGLSFESLTKAGAIAGIGALSAKALDSAVSFDQAMNQFAASTGTSTEELEKYEGVLENIYSNNYGEDFMDIANAMAEVKKQVGDLDEADLQNLTESAFALRDTFDFDITESVRTAKNMMDNFGITGEEAMNLIANGAQSNINKNGDMLDVLNEYSVQFAKLGFSAEDMFKILENGADSGAFSVDKVGDAMKEFSIRAIDGSDTTKAAFKAMGLDADEMAKKFAAGGDSAREAFNETVAALMSMEDPLAQNTAGVNLFGTMWEDLGPEAIGTLAGIEEGAYGTADAMNTIKEVKYDDLGSMFEALTRQLELLLIPLGEALIPILSALIQTVLPVLQSLLPPLIEVLNACITPILGIIQSLTPLIEQITDMLMPIIQALVPLFTQIFSSLAQIVNEAIQYIILYMQPIISFINTVLMPVINGLVTAWTASFKSLGDGISAIIQSMKQILQGMIDFIAGVFTGNWSRAWSGVKSIFSGIVSGIANIFKAPINTIISGINTFISGLNKIKIPSWVPGVGGLGFNLPKIPRLKVGMDFVPSDFYPAYLDYGEAVLTKEQNAKLRSWGGIENIEQMLSVMPFSGVDSELDYEKLAQAMAGVSIPIYLDGKVVGYSVTGAVDQNMGIITSRKGRYGI